MPFSEYVLMPSTLKQLMARWLTSARRPRKSRSSRAIRGRFETLETRELLAAAPVLFSYSTELHKFWDGAGINRLENLPTDPPSNFAPYSEPGASFDVVHGMDFTASVDSGQTTLEAELSASVEATASGSATVSQKTTSRFTPNGDLGLSIDAYAVSRIDYYLLGGEGTRAVVNYEISVAIGTAPNGTASLPSEWRGGIITSDGVLSLSLIPGNSDQRTLEKKDRTLVLASGKSFTDADNNVYTHGGTIYGLVEWGMGWWDRSIGVADIQAEMSIEVENIGIDDIAAESLYIRDDGVVGFYKVFGRLSTPVDVGLYWSDGSNVIGEAIKKERAVSYFTIYPRSYPLSADPAYFANPPGGATELVLIVDPPGPDTPEGADTVEPASNNRASVSWSPAWFDINVLEVIHRVPLGSPAYFEVPYRISGSDLPGPANFTAFWGFADASLKQIPGSWPVNPRVGDYTLRLTDGNLGVRPPNAVALLVQADKLVKEIAWDNNWRVVLFDAPSIGGSGPPLQPVYSEGQSATPLAPAATAYPPLIVSPSFANGSLSKTVFSARVVSNAQASDRLLIRNTSAVKTVGNKIMVDGVVVGTVSGGAGSAPLVMQWNQNAGPWRVTQVLRNVAYQNISKDLSGQEREVKFRFAANGVANEYVKLIAIHPINDAPQLAGFPATTNYVMGAPPFQLAPSATVADVDNPNFAAGRLVVRVASGAANGNGILIRGAFSILADQSLPSPRLFHNGVDIGSINADGGIGTTPLVVIFNERATQPIVQQLLRALWFRTWKVGATDPKVITAALFDGNGRWSNTVSTTVNVSK